MSDYATIDDVESLWRPLSEDETERATALIPVICDSLRYEAQKVGKDLDVMVEASAFLTSVAKSVTVDVVARTLMSSTTGIMDPVSQFSQSALGYSVSGTYANPGGGLFIKKSELARLGLRRQRYGVIMLDGSEGSEDD